MRWFRWVVLAIVLLTIARLSFFTIDASEYGYVAVLGRPTATLDGGNGGAGLHIGLPWPIQSVQRIDRRLQVFDLRPLELLTPDPDGKSVDKNLTVEACVFWKIADEKAVDRFIRRLGTAEQARNILGERISSQLGAAISRMHLSDLISTAVSKTEPGKLVAELKVEELRKNLLASLRDQVNEEYGIELVDIRLKRYNYPAATREAIFDLIKSGRRKKRKEYEAEGDRRYIEITAEAEGKARDMLATAKFEEQRIKAEADAEATLIRNRAHGRDPEFYAFLKKLEQYQSMLGEGRSMLLLSTHRPMFDLLFGPPKPGKVPEDKKGSVGPEGSK